MIVQANIGAPAGAHTLGPGSGPGMRGLARVAGGDGVSKAARISTGAGLSAGGELDRSGPHGQWRILDEVSLSMTRLQTRVAHLEKLAETVERMTELARRAEQPGLAAEERQRLASEFDRLTREVGHVATKRFGGEPLFGRGAPVVILETEHERFTWDAPDLEAPPYAGVQTSQVTSPTTAGQALQVLEETARTLRSDRDRLREALDQLAGFAERLQVRAENFAAARLRLTDAGAATAAVEMVRKRLLVRADEALQGQDAPPPERVLRLVS